MYNGCSGQRKMICRSRVSVLEAHRLTYLSGPREPLNELNRGRNSGRTPSKKVRQRETINFLGFPSREFRSSLINSSAFQPWTSGGSDFVKGPARLIAVVNVIETKRVTMIIAVLVVTISIIYCCYGNWLYSGQRSVTSVQGPQQM